MKAVLEGMVVIDWSTGHVGPSASAMLADLGSDVIHVEEKGIGDMTRGLTHFLGQPQVIKGRNIQFEQFNTNKRGIAIDLKKPRGHEIMERLVKRADVFITNFRAKAAKKLGLDYDTLKEVNPNLIYASSNALGPEGPDNDVGGYELISYARSGVMMSSGEEGMPPIMPTVGMGDRIGSVYLAFSALAALFARERHGIAQEAKTSQLGGLMNLESWSLTATIFHRKDPPRPPRTETRNPLYNWYLCKDRTWIALAMLQSDRFWPVFCKAMGIPELEKDNRFATSDKRAENCREIISILDKVFITKTFNEWEKIFRENDLQFTKINRLSDLRSDPQVIANRYIREWDHPHWGPIEFPGFPYSLSETPLTLRTPAPELGQHTEEILLECGYNWEEITRLAEDKVI